MPKCLYSLSNQQGATPLADSIEVYEKVTRLLTRLLHPEMFVFFQFHVHSLIWKFLQKDRENFGSIWLRHLCSHVQNISLNCKECFLKTSDCCSLCSFFIVSLPFSASFYFHFPSFFTFSRISFSVSLPVYLFPCSLILFSTALHLSCF